MISLRIEKLCSSAPRAKDNRGTAARAINPNRHNYPTHSFHLPMHFVSTCLLFIAECDIASFLRCPAGAPLQDDAPYCIIDIWEERHFRPRVKDHFYANPKMRHSSPYDRILSACAYLPRMRRSPDLPAWIALAASLSRLSSGLSSDSAPTGIIGHATRAQRLLERGLGKGEGAGRIATEDYRTTVIPPIKLQDLRLLKGERRIIQRVLQPTSKLLIVLVSSREHNLLIGPRVLAHSEKCQRLLRGAIAAEARSPESRKQRFKSESS